MIKRMDNAKLNLVQLKKTDSIPFAMIKMGNATVLFGILEVLLLILIYKKTSIK